jgi:hypothetical protein
LGHHSHKCTEALKTTSMQNSQHAPSSLTSSTHRVLPCPGQSTVTASMQNPQHAPSSLTSITHQGGALSPFIITANCHRQHAEPTACLKIFDKQHTPRWCPVPIKHHSLFLPTGMRSFSRGMLQHAPPRGVSLWTSEIPASRTPETPFQKDFQNSDVPL